MVEENDRVVTGTRRRTRVVLGFIPVGAPINDVTLSVCRWRCAIDERDICHPTEFMLYCTVAAQNGAESRCKVSDMPTLSP